jgi:hypothetical protein
MSYMRSKPFYFALCGAGMLIAAAINTLIVSVFHLSAECAFLLGVVLGSVSILLANLAEFEIGNRRGWY